MKIIQFWCKNKLKLYEITSTCATDSDLYGFHYEFMEWGFGKNCFLFCVVSSLERLDACTRDERYELVWCMCVNVFFFSSFTEQEYSVLEALLTICHEIFYLFCH